MANAASAGTVPVSVSRKVTETRPGPDGNVEGISEGEIVAIAVEAGGLAWSEG
jgi:hypothetical protein